MPEGPCALCRNVRELCDSHYLPRASYKRSGFSRGARSRAATWTSGAGFPGNLALSVSVNGSTKILPNEYAVLPFLKARTPAQRQYKFLVPGLGFELFIGKAIPASVRAMCVVRSPQGFLFTSDSIEEATLAEIAKLVLKPQDAR